MVVLKYYFSPLVKICKYIRQVYFWNTTGKGLIAEFHSSCSLPNCPERGTWEPSHPAIFAGSFLLCLLPVVVVQSLSHVWLFVIPWAAARQAPLSSTISQSLLKFMSIESGMVSNHLILCGSLLLLPSVFPSIRVFSSEWALRSRWPKCRSFSFTISPSNDYSGLISFRIDWFDLLDVQGTLRVFFSTTVWKHQFFGTQPSLWTDSYLYMTTGKAIGLTIQTFVSKVMSLLFNMLSRFVIAFLSRGNLV